MTDRFPEIVAAARELPDGTVLDGEILPWRDGRVLLFLNCSGGLDAKNLTAKILSEVPVILQCYDLLEFERRDIRSVDFRARREMLGALLNSLSDAAKHIFRITEAVEATTWQQLADKRN
jgi:DNA ligase-1